MGDGAGNLEVAPMTGVGHESAAVLYRVGGGLAGRIVVGAVDSDDVGAVGGYRLFATGRDRAVEVDHAVAAEQLGAPGD